MIYLYMESPGGEKSEKWGFRAARAAGSKFQDSSFKLLDSLREKSIKNPTQKSVKIDVTL